MQQSPDDPNNLPTDQSTAETKTPLLTKKRLLLLAGLSVGVVTIIVIVALIAGSGDESNSSDASKASNYRNWLAPTQEVKVANQRAFSPCQVLDLASIEKVRGSLPADTRINTEQYLDTSVSGGGDEVRNTSCEYSFNKDRAYLSLQLDIEQFTDPSRTTTYDKFLLTPKYGDITTGAVALGFDVDVIDDRIAAYETIASNDATKAIIKQLKASAVSYKAYSQSDGANSAALVERVNSQGLLLPSAQDDFGYEFFYKNSLFTLYDEANEGSDDAEIETTEPRDRFALGAGYMMAIINNAKNANLSQSPAPTYLGDTDRYGDSPILEPCHVLTSDIFNQVQGVAPNFPTERQSTYRDVSKERQARLSNGKTVTVNPANKCVRYYRSDTGLTQMVLSLEYTGSSNALEANLRDRESGEPSQVATAADKLFVSDDGSGNIAYYFTVGDYLATALITTNTFGSGPSEDVITQADQAKYVQLINAVVPNIKQDKATANASKN